MLVITIILSLISLFVSFWTLTIVNDCMKLVRKIILTVSKIVLDKGNETLRKSKGEQNVYNS